MTEIQIEITNKCPSKCIHCSSKGLRAGSEPSGISINNVKKLIECIPGQKQIYLTGGEPLCYEEMDRFCEMVSQCKDASVGLYTCGLISQNGTVKAIDKARARKLKRLGINRCYFSLYGKDAQSHNFVTGINSFDDTCESIRNIQEAGISACAHVVLTKIAYEQIEDIIFLASKLHMESVRLLRLVKAGSAVDHWEQIGLDTEDQEKRIIETMKTPNNSKMSITISGFPHIFPCRDIPCSVGCQRGINLLYVTYSGDIFPCACVKNRSNQKIGNINDRELAIEKIKPHNNVSYYPTCLNHA